MKVSFYHDSLENLIENELNSHYAKQYTNEKIPRHLLIMKRRIFTKING